MNDVLIKIAGERHEIRAKTQDAIRRLIVKLDMAASTGNPEYIREAKAIAECLANEPVILPPVYRKTGRILQ